MVPEWCTHVLQLCSTRTVCVVRTWRLKLKNIMFPWTSLCTCWPPSSGKQLLNLFSVTRCVACLCTRGGQCGTVSLCLIWQLLLLKKLKFHLTVHSPFRPLEGFIIDIKVCVHVVCTHTHMHTHTHAHTHTCTYTRAHTHTHMHTLLLHLLCFADPFTRYCQPRPVQKGC